MMTPGAPHDNDNATQSEIVLNTLTNNWAGASQQQTRPGLLPPIKHRLTTAVQNFPVIPPITAVKASVSRSQSRGQGHDDEVREDVSEADTAETRESIKKRNTHLLKVYLASLAQLLVVLLIVVSLTEVKEVRDFQRQHNWIWALASGVMSADTRQRRVNLSYTQFNNTEDPWRENLTNTTQPPPLRSLNYDILFPSNMTELENETSETFNEELGFEETVPRMYQQKLMVSTATLSVSYCVVICGIFVLINAQQKFDGDFMGGLLHALVIIILTVICLMVFTRNIVWPRLWYAGFGAFFLWFFHRMVVFPLIALLFPFKMFSSTTQTETLVLER